MDEPQFITTPSQTKIGFSASSSWAELEWIDPKDLDINEWRRIASILKASVDLCAELSLVHMLRRVKNYDSILLGVVGTDRLLLGAIVCSSCKFPTGYSVLNVDACSVFSPTISRGNMKSIVSELEALAVKTGCDAVRISGRRAWGKVFSDYSEAHTTFDKIVKEKS